MSQSTDLLSAIGNKNHTETFLAHYATEIRNNTEMSKQLHAAPNYYAWLCVASEHVLYSARMYIYRITTNQAVFDYQYKQTLDWFQNNNNPLSSSAREGLVLFTKIRHILVHKGFPNPHEVPSSNDRLLQNGQVFTSEEVRDTVSEIVNPSYFNYLSEKYTDVEGELQKAQREMVSNAYGDGSVVTNTST